MKKYQEFLGKYVVVHCDHHHVRWEGRVVAETESFIQIKVKGFFGALLDWHRKGDVQLITNLDETH